MSPKLKQFFQDASTVNTHSFRSGKAKEIWTKRPLNALGGTAMNIAVVVGAFSLGSTVAGTAGITFIGLPVFYGAYSPAVHKFIGNKITKNNSPKPPTT